MRILGKWDLCEDDVVRPMLFLDVINGARTEDWFLIDTGADRTVLSAGLLKQLGAPQASAPLGFALAGIGGPRAFVQVQITLNLRRSDGGVAVIEGSFAAFTDEEATDFSILGRDVLDHMDLILSRRRNEVILIAPPTRYEILSS
jgi:hypothetical protein